MKALAIHFGSIAGFKDLPNGGNEKRVRTLRFY